MNTIIDKAQIFAQEKHKGQKYGSHPYSVHLLEAYKIAEKFKLSENIKVACFLHDTLEDTKTSYAEIKKEFGKDVAELVYSVTDELGRNRKERKKKTYPKILNAGLESVKLKLCDRIANIENAIQSGNLNKMLMYAKEHPKIKELFVPYYAEQLEHHSIWIYYCSLFKS